MPHRADQVDGKTAPKRFADLTYDRFREMAQDESLSETEKIGSPDAFRVGFEDAILSDFAAKLPAFHKAGATLVDIGAGCGELARRLIALTAAQNQRLIAIDSPEMLEALPDAAHLLKIPGRFPQDTLDAARDAAPNGADSVIAYGVLQSVYFDSNANRFVDEACSLLAPGGGALFGDVSNHSKLRRYLNSDAGRQFHKAYMRTEDDPEVPAFVSDPSRLDDGVLVGMMLRARNAGYDAYLLPQPSDLPVSNRREDLLILRP